MNGFRNNNPMCYWDKRKLKRGDATTSNEPNNTGSTFRVTRYKDGTSTVHHGGPCGDSHYDENGEEC